MEKSQFTKQFWNLINQSSKILITSHKNPDDDSISSTIFLHETIKEKFPNKTLQIIYTGEFSERWNKISHIDLIQSSDDIAEIISDFDLLIVLDVFEYERFSNNTDLIQSFSGKKICIDHHQTQANMHYDLYFYEQATSTAEMLYNLFIEKDKSVRKDLCEILLIGIMGDSGWLTWGYKPENTEIFNIAGKLVKDGNIHLEELKNKIYGYSKNTFQMIQELIKNTKFITINEWPELLYSYLSREFVENNNIEEINIKEASSIFISTYGKSIKETSWSASAYPQKDGNVSISLRSRNKSINVRLLAELMEKGGGHNGASSIKFKSLSSKKLQTESCLNELFDWIKSNSPIYRED